MSVGRALAAMRGRVPGHQEHVALGAAALGSVLRGLLVPTTLAAAFVGVAGDEASAAKRRPASNAAVPAAARPGDQTRKE